MALIELRQVTRRFGDLTAVDGVSLEVGRGEIVGLLGHNGAGKTTLIRVINGLLEADAGRVLVAGLDPIADGDRVRRLTGVLTEYPALDEYLTVAENLRAYATINGVPRRSVDGQVDALIDRLGLAERRDAPARSLSAGLKQRVALARSLVHDPDIMLLDEPTTNMDPVAAREVRRLVVERVQQAGATVLLSTHNLPEAEQLCDRVAIIRKGVLLRCGMPAELRRAAPPISGVRITTDPSWEGHLLQLADGQLRAHTTSPCTVELLGRTDVPAIVRELAAGGVPIHAVEPLGATLEDLYLALHVDDDPSTAPGRAPLSVPVPPPQDEPGAPRRVAS